MGKRTRERAKDYVLEEDGSYRYAGKSWRWVHPEERTPFVRTSWLLLGVAAACLVGVGFIPTRDVGGALYVLLPYAVAVVATALVGSSLWKLTREGETLRNHIYESCVLNLTPKLMLGVVASFSSAVGAAFQALVGTGSTRKALLFALLMLMSGACLAQILRRSRTLRFIEA